MEPHILAIDHGTSGIKAAIVSARGEVRDFEVVTTPICFLEDGGVEQDPEDWWNALVTAAGRLVQRAAVPAAAIRAVSVSSTFSTTVAIDAAGIPVMPALTWMDGRGGAAVRRVVGGFPSLLGYNLARAAKWIRRSGGAPSLSGKDDAAHVLFLQQQRPELYRRTHVFLPSKDYLNFRLTGEIAASYDSMHLFWCTDTRDPSRVHYDPELIAMLGIDAAKLPPMRDPIAVLGTLTATGATALGLTRDVQVVLGSPDHQCALAGSGAVRDFEAHLYIGTSSWIECLVPFKKTDALHSIASFPTFVSGRYQCINEQDLAGGALGFLADNLLFRTHKLLGTPVPEARYELIDRIAAAARPGSNGVLFTPWLNGERTPVDDPHVRGGFHNLTTTTTMDDMVRAVLEGVALNTRWSLGYVERFCGRRLDPIRLVGGGGKSDLWCQIFADVLQRDVQRVVDPMQANARGAAFLAARGLGWLRFEDIPGLVPIDKTFHPNPALRGLYDNHFQALVKHYRPSSRLARLLNSPPR